MRIFILSQYLSNNVVMAGCLVDGLAKVNGSSALLRLIDMDTLLLHDNYIKPWPIEHSMMKRLTPCFQS